MKWLEISVYTTDEGLDYVCAALDGAGTLSNMFGLILNNLGHISNFSFISLNVALVSYV